VNASNEGRTVKTRAAMLAAALAVLLLTVAAVASGCGASSSSDDGVAALDDSSTEDVTPASDREDDDEAPTEQERQDAALEWAKCMREHGVDVPDPKFDSDGGVQIRVGGPGLDPRSDRFREARDACGMPFGRGGPPNLSEEERQQFQEAMLEFARCMRDHGVDMPDPEFGEGGRGVFRVGPVPGGKSTAEGEKFEEAQEACQPILEELRERREAEGSGS
jgi:hypothetical protein